MWCFLQQLIIFARSWAEHLASLFRTFSLQKRIQFAFPTLIMLSVLGTALLKGMTAAVVESHPTAKYCHARANELPPDCQSAYCTFALVAILPRIHLQKTYLLTQITLSKIDNTIYRIKLSAGIFKTCCQQQYSCTQATDG